MRRGADSIQNVLNADRNNGGKWDITGLSSSTEGGNVPVVLGNMRTIRSSYGKPAMSAWYSGTRRPSAAMDGFPNV